MAKVEQPIFILPKKRNAKKPLPLPVASHVDHIITVQGAEPEVPISQVKFKNGLSPVTEQIANGTIHSTMEGFKSNMKINLPVIKDVNDEELSVLDADENQAQNNKKHCYQTLSYVHNSREVIDLSPIYENSSDGYSSHGDLCEITDEFHKGGKILNMEHNESSSATPNSISHTQSDNSFEMGSLSDSCKTASAKRKKRVNIVSEVIDNDSSATEITALRGPEESITKDHKEGYLTMTGTIRRGKQKGQNVDVKLNISREELEVIEAAIVADEHNKMNLSRCSLSNGPHVFVFTLVCLPFITCISASYSFYVGTMTWYNIFTHVTEELNCIQKVFWAPVVMLLYPFLILIFTVGLGLYAGIVQVTFSGVNWWKGVCDFEKGFYGWLCNFLGLSECSPYEVVILMDVKPI